MYSRRSDDAMALLERERLNTIKIVATQNVINSVIYNNGLQLIYKTWIQYLLLLMKRYQVHSVHFCLSRATRCRVGPRHCVCVALCPD